MSGKNQSRSTGDPALPIGGNTGEHTPRPTPVRSSARTIAALATSSHNSDVELLESTSSLDDSAKHLLAVMRGLSGRDVESVKAACMCAKEIANLARAKIEYIKALTPKREEY